uniref:Uncharacterized protein n=1 Tax=Anguilla anguilla TaxID=7936 RepID=A0A0E9PKA6_ANGAN
MLSVYAHRKIFSVKSVLIDYFNSDRVNILGISWR